MQNESQNYSATITAVLGGIFLAWFAVKVSVWILPIAGIAYLVHVWRKAGRELEAHKAANLAEDAKLAAHRAYWDAVMRNPNLTANQITQLEDSGEWWQPECAARLAEPEKTLGALDR